jgi:hypothetical protein
MTITLELKPEVEARVVEEAASRGVPVEDFLECVIEESLDGGEGHKSYQTMEEWEVALDEFANSPAFGRAVSFVDDSRESIYRDREDSQL